MRNQTDPIYTQDAAALAEMIRDKETTFVEIVQVHLDRIAELNPELNALVNLIADIALGAAAEADKAVANGEPFGPLHGVPYDYVAGC